MSGAPAHALASRAAAADEFAELEVANASFLVDKLGGECGDLQGLRELTVNGLEASAALGDGAEGKGSGTWTGSATSAPWGASASCR